MCGIAGIANLTTAAPVEPQRVAGMLATIRHRGPDQFGIYADDHVGLGNARLGIIDLAGGQQPIANEDETLWIVFNGEIFNYVELRPELEARGHRFRTHTDTEVVLHLYEEYGPECLHYLNGQFAIAIWNTRDQTLFLARDRMGIRPLFYTQTARQLVFGSEIKAILASGAVNAAIDPVAMGQIFTFWSTLPPRTMFRDIYEVPAGHYLFAKRGRIDVRQYWDVSFDGVRSASSRTIDEDLDELRALLIDATRIRLRADVPVGAYLSGGLDSSTIAAVVRKYATNHLDTFSIAFSDPQFDESEFQRRMAAHLGTRHNVLFVNHADIGRVFPQVTWHAETALLRTAPAPMYLLSKMVRDAGYKVVLTGEGADECLAGYDLFKEAAVRRFWSRQPGSRVRPQLLRRLYPDIAGLASTSINMLAGFFGDRLQETHIPYYSHAIRWRNTRRTQRLFTPELTAAAGPDPVAGVAYPAGFDAWGPLEKAQYLEMRIFLSQYLLSSQGDRMGMANSIEGRFPFLDYRVVEFCARVAADRKLRGLQEKYLLKLFGRELLPSDIWQRPKRPYRAPIHRSFFCADGPEYVRDVLSPAKLQAAGLFKPAGVAQLIAKIDKGAALGESDDMALAGIISTQLVYEQFVEHFRTPSSLTAADDVKICLRTKGEALVGAANEGGA